MKAIVLIGLLSILVCRVFAQNEINIWYKDCTNCANNDEDGSKNYSYSDSKQFKIEDINHNFDRRNTGSSSATKWHRGWDINLSSLADKGDIIVSNVNGTTKIMDINPKLDGGKTGMVIVTIAADNNSNNAFSYLHGWRSDENPITGVRSGDLVLLDPNKDKNYCILDTKNKKAWCEVSYKGDNFSFESDNYTPIYTRQYGDPIYPVGTSGAYSANGDPNYHTHVEVIKPFIFDNDGNYVNGLNARCPAVLLNLTTDQKGLGQAVQKNPNIDVYDATNQPGVSIRYPGNKPTSIKARISIDGVTHPNAPYNKVAMVDQIQYLVTPKSEPLVNKLIAGKSLKGEINIGSNKTRYPESIKDNIGKHYSGNSDGVTGMESFAYNNSTGAHPWDDYYFSDFASRKNSIYYGYADFPRYAQYPDGNYNMAVCAYEAGDAVHFKCSSVHPFSIDNFLPYVNIVNVESFKFLTPEVIYYRAWLEEDPNTSVANNGFLKSGGKFNGKDNDFVTYYRVTASTSESMSNMNCKFKTFVNAAVKGVPLNLMRTEWSFDLVQYKLLDGNDYTLHFEGADYSGNSLLKTHALASQAQGQTILNPVRMNASGTNQWSPAGNATTGFDEYHILKIYKGCGGNKNNPNQLRSGDCFEADFSYEILPDGYSVQFKNLSEGDPTSYKWDFGDGAESSEVDPKHEYEESGNYTVTLTANKNGDKDEKSQTVKIEDVPSGGNLIVEISGSEVVELASHHYYEAKVTGGYPPYQYFWSLYDGFGLGTCPKYYSGTTDAKFGAEFLAPCTVGTSGKIKVTVIDANSNTVESFIDVVISGEAPTCKIVWSGKQIVNSEIDFKIVNSDVLQAIDCKDYYAYYDWVVEGIGNAYYDDNYKNILWWLLGYKFPSNGYYKVTAKGRKDLYGPSTGQFSTIIAIGENLAPQPPNPPFEFFPSNTINVVLGEKLSGDEGDNFYMALLYKNSLDQEGTNCPNRYDFNARSYDAKVTVKAAGSGTVKTYSTARDLYFGNWVGFKLPLFNWNEPNPINLVVGPDNFGCNDITVEVTPRGIYCVEYEPADVFCNPIGNIKQCDNLLYNDEPFSNCFFCPEYQEPAKLVTKYKYDLPIVIEKKCAFLFDPPQMVMNPASVQTLNCGITYLEADVTGGAPFTSNNFTPSGFPCNGSLQPYSKYEWSSFSLGDDVFQLMS